jgi:hypothetical protein
MTLNEFSDMLTTMLNSYANQAQFGEQASHQEIALDEYEKSVFLTKAQEEITLGLYNGRNPLGEAFEGSEELRRYLSKLVVEAEKTPITNSSSKPIGVAGSNSYFFNLPDNPAVWFITYEAVEISSEDACKDGSTIEVVPIKQDEYHRLKKNPFRGTNDHRALRLDLSDDNVEIVSEYPVSKYYIRYIRRLNPIILANLDGNDIGGETTATECELPDILHQKILERAVVTALQSKGLGMPSQARKED